MGTHTQHIPVTAPTCASPAGEWHCHILGGDQELAASAGAQVPGAHTHPGDSTENSAATAAPVGFTEWDLPLGFTLWDLPRKAAGVLVQPDFPYWLYNGTETKTLFPKGQK